MKKINFSIKRHISAWKTASKKKKAVIAVVFIGGIGIVSAGIVFLANRPISQMPAVEMTVQEAQASAGDISNTIVGTGNLAIDDSVSITIPSGIIIEEVKVESGEHVSKGDVLAVVNEASVLSAMTTVQSELDELDEALNESKDDTDTETITAKVEGRVKKIYVQEGSDAAESMISNGALLLLSLDGKMAVDLEGVPGVSVDESVNVTLSDGTVKEGTVENVNEESCTLTLTDNGVAMDDAVTVTKTDGTSLGSGNTYIHEKLEITATGGTVSDIAVAENEEVYQGTTLLSLENDEESAEYRQQAAQRQKLAESLQKLIVMSQTGTITADTDGTVGSINVSGSSGDSQSVENMSATGDSIQASYMSYTSVKEETEQENNKKLQIEIVNTGKSTKDTLVLEIPETGKTPQKEIMAEDGSYTGVICWNPDDNTFTAGTEYQADVMIYASDDYLFGCDSILKVQTGLLSNVSVEEDGKTISFHMTFPSTEKEQNNVNNVGGTQENLASAGTTQNTPAAQNTPEVQDTAAQNTQIAAQNTTAVQSASATAQSTSASEQDTEEDYSSEVTAFTLASDDSMILSVSVDELDINSVSEDQEAEVTLDAIEDTSFTGTVTKVGSSASSSGNGVAKYTVEITIPKDERMKTGMNASATIVIEKKENVITIPVNALQEKGEKVFVYTQKDTEGNLSGEQEVTTGLSDGDKVEITGGLSEGDTVYYQKTGNTSNQSSNGMSQDGMKGGMGEMPEGGGFPGGAGEMPSQGPGQGGMQ